MNQTREERLRRNYVGRQDVRFHHRYFGRWGVTFTTSNEGDSYGLRGSRGRSFHLVLWRDPKDTR